MNIEDLADGAGVVGCVVNREGHIRQVSQGWKQHADRNGLGLESYGLGSNYLSYCRPVDARSTEIYRGLRSVFAGDSGFYSTIYPCHAAHQPRKWFLLAALSPSAEGEERAVLHLDVSPFLQGPAGPGDRRSEYGSLHDTIVQTVRRAVREEIREFRTTTQPSERIGDRRLAGLTPRQVLILRELARGSSNERIAKALNITLNAAKSQTAALIRKLDFENRVQAALFAARLGLDRHD